MQSWMRRLFIFLAAGFSLWTSACDDEAGGHNAERREVFSSATDTFNGPDVVVSGQSLFGDYCASCHGAIGEGIPGAGPQIRNPVLGYASYVVRTGRNEMAEFPQSEMPSFPESALSDESQDMILAWLRQAEKPTDGQGLYTRFCANCHGFDALGGRVNVNLLEEVQEAPSSIFEIVREGHGGTRYGSRTLYMPAWPASELSDAEITAVAAYLSAL